jgi:hypothetical protein
MYVQLQYVIYELLETQSCLHYLETPNRFFHIINHHTRLLHTYYENTQSLNRIPDAMIHEARGMLYKC